MVLTLNPDPTDEEDSFAFFFPNAIDGALEACLLDASPPAKRAAPPPPPPPPTTPFLPPELLRQVASYTDARSLAALSRSNSHLHKSARGEWRVRCQELQVAWGALHRCFLDEIGTVDFCTPVPVRPRAMMQTIHNRHLIADTALDMADEIISRHWKGSWIWHLWRTHVRAALLTSGAALFTHPPRAASHDLELLAFVPYGPRREFLQFACYITE